MSREDWYDDEDDWGEKPDLPYDESDEEPDAEPDEEPDEDLLDLDDEYDIKEEETKFRRFRQKKRRKYGFDED